MAPSSKLLRLPARGRLLVAADLHGNLRDFLAIAAAFERMQHQGNDAFLLFLGDLLHGPYLPIEKWREGDKDTPHLRGRPYTDQSPAILLELCELMTRHPRRVFALLGNHEHAHIGGPRTSLFARDEALTLEQRLGPEVSHWLARFLKRLPLWALSPCGVLFSHAAPAAELLGPAALSRLEDLEAIDYRRYTPPRPEARPGKSTQPVEAAARLLGQLLWASSMGPAHAQELLIRIGARVAVYGHAVVPAGYQTIGKEQLILSSSFGMEDSKKRVLLLDLGGRYLSAADLRPGIEILPLYPLCAGEPLARLQPSR